ncbi:hypothetical protein NMY22_g7345 [Coprinellus aureogranulatus]|nr:hypothetical protein NMY22_g7345 [Coprinellus aureogranulatus]
MKPPSRPWIPRVERWVQDVELKPNTDILVEGIFKVNEVASMTVLAKMQYTPSLKEGERYSIINSCFWVG